MSRYLLSEHAQQDFLAHERHTAERFGERQADRLSDAFFAAFDRVAAHPSAGHVRDDLAPPGRPLRFITASKVFLIVYEPVDEGIDIVRIFHGSQDVKAELAAMTVDDDL